MRKNLDKAFLEGHAKGFNAKSLFRRACKKAFMRKNIH